MSILKLTENDYTYTVELINAIQKSIAANSTEAPKLDRFDGSITHSAARYRFIEKCGGLTIELDQFMCMPNSQVRIIPNLEISGHDVIRISKDLWKPVVTLDGNKEVIHQRALIPLPIANYDADRTQMTFRYLPLNYLFSIDDIDDARFMKSGFENINYIRISNELIEIVASNEILKWYEENVNNTQLDLYITRVVFKVDSAIDPFVYAETDLYAIFRIQKEMEQNAYDDEI